MRNPFTRWALTRDITRPEAEPGPEADAGDGYTMQEVAAMLDADVSSTLAEWAREARSADTGADAAASARGHAEAEPGLSADDSAAEPEAEA